MYTYKTITAVIITCGIFICAGCGGKHSMNTGNELRKNLRMPKFMYKLPKEKGYVYAAGACAVRAQDRDPDFAVTMADHRARRKIQQYLANCIASTVKEYSSQAGYSIIESDEALLVASVAIGSLDISAAQVVKREFVEGVMYSLVKWPLDSKKREAILRAVRDGLYGKDALRSKFAAEKEWSKLEEMLKKSMDKQNDDG